MLRQCSKLLRRQGVISQAARHASSSAGGGGVKVRIMIRSVSAPACLYQGPGRDRGSDWRGGGRCGGILCPGRGVQEDCGDQRAGV